MTAQRILRDRRLYNKWVNSQTLEDYALRYTATAARRWSARRIAGTALGAASFLACEAIGAAITIAFGFGNALAAIGAAIVLMFLIGLPIAYHAAREGLDVDLLTRGAGFGYLGSTLTSLIYASFTFLLFAIEASIMSGALELAFGIPLPIAHIISALVVIPIALYGMRAITRFQVVTQPVWILLQLAPIVYVAVAHGDDIARWTAFAGGAPGGVALIPFGLALSTLLSLLPQIGEQADYLRFLPRRETIGRTRWWAALLAGGPGWVFVGGAKLALGSFLAVYALNRGLSLSDAADPADMFFVVFRDMAGSPGVALLLTAMLVVVAQMKINVTNAYAGSIAWSNFFSRLTHAHPGRVVWLVFNVLLALLLMELGILQLIAGILTLYASLAAAWIGALSADLVISKPLGLSPRGVEFKRAYLFDLNPVGIGAVALSIAVSVLAMTGMAGAVPQAFAPLLGLATAFVAAPAIALATRGRFYIARVPVAIDGATHCVICENPYEGPDIAHCPVYAGPICSLCCTLETRCHDICKADATFAEQITAVLTRLLPARLAASVDTTVGHFVGALLLFTIVIGGVLLLIYAQYAALAPLQATTIATTLWIVFVTLSMLAGIAAWLIVLAHDSRRAAERDTAQQTRMLRAEIAAHGETDRALQHAKEAAEAANEANTRYLTAVSHEIRSPLNAIYGYSQLLERDGPVRPGDAARVIRRSSEHLGNLVEGLLEISRIESGVLRLSRDTVPLRATLEQFIDMFRAQADEKGLTLRLDAERLPSHVRTDEKRFRQIVINLLSNAIKYTDEGSVDLRVRYRSQIATIEVVDSGSGIDAADHERIFEPFERGVSPGALAQPGVGLGLTITRSLARIMGGDLTVTSTPGDGSCFTLRLLLPQPAEPPVETVRAKAIVGFDGAAPTVLGVDDDAAQIAVLIGLLAPLGFDLHTASNGRDGVARAVEVQPALVLMDIQMRGGIDGWQAAREIRAALGAAVRIVMVSANASEFVAGGDGEQPHDAFVTKPVDLDRLLDTIATQLGLRWRDAGGAKSPRAIPPRADMAAAARGAGTFVDALSELIRIGHVRGIAAKLDEMEAALPDSAPLAARARASLDVLDLKALARLMESVRG